MPTWADVQRVPPRWVLWAVLVVLVADVRAVVHLRSDRAPGCARGSVPTAQASLRTGIELDQPTSRSGEDVQVTVRLENAGTRDVAVAGLQAVVVAPAGGAVLSWSDRVRPLGLVVRPGEFGEVPLTVHLARCPHGDGLAPGWYELVVVVTEPGRRGRSAVRTLVVAP